MPNTMTNMKQTPSVDFIAMNPLMQSTLQHIEDVTAEQLAVTGLATGFTQLDSLTGGLQPQSLTVLTGRAGGGKSALALSMVERVLLQNLNKPVVIFSTKMPAQTVMTRLLFAVGRIDHTCLQNGKMDYAQFDGLAMAARVLKDLPLFVNDTPRPTPQMMRASLQTLVQQHSEPSLVVVDCLQALAVSDNDEMSVEESGHCANELKQLAVDFNCPVLLLSQLGTHSNQRPTHTDILNASVIEPSADVFMLLYRIDAGVTHGSLAAMELMISKNRGGSIGRVLLNFDQRFLRFQQHNELDSDVQSIQID